MTIQATSTQDQDIARFITQAVRNQEQGRRLPYTLSGRGALNCAGFVSTALQAGGLQVPTVHIPELLVLTLTALRAEGKLIAIPP